MTDSKQADFGEPRPIRDFQGQPDGVTWVKRESLVDELKVERDYLREMLRLALTSNQESKP